MPLRSTTIHVCPWSLLEQTTDAAGADHVITLLRNHEQVVTPRRVEPANHLRIDINDIAQPMDGMVHPQDEHVAEVIRFAEAWDHRSPLVIHCYAGISRSTAAAFVSLCALNPEVPEARIARLLRQASPTATPNRLIVQIADDTLGRGGRMADAVEAIGIGRTASEAVPFSLPSRLAAR